MQDSALHPFVRPTVPSAPARPALAAVLAALALLLAAPAALAQDAAGAPSGTLELAVDQAPVGLDPHVVTAFSSFAVLQQIYDALLEANAELELEPALAESWTVSDDGLVYTVELRDDVVFHNGRAMTADDVVFSLERILDEATGSPLASRFSEVASAEASGEHQVTFTLNEPFAPFLSNLTSLYVVPREVAEAGEDGLQRNAVGTGPFVLEEIVPDTEVRLAANPDYYREGQPKVAALVYHIVPEAATRAAGVRTGSYHLLPTVDPASAETLRAAPSVTLLESQDLAYSLLGLNVRSGALSDPAVRAALNGVVDREEIVEGVYFGNAVPGGPLSPALSSWALPVSEFACYAPTGDAAAALEGAGELTVELLTFGTIKEVSDLAQVLQAQLADAGVDATVKVEEFGSFVQRWRNAEFDSFVSLNNGSIDPDGYLYRTFHSGGSTNVYGYADPEVDALLEEGRTTTDTAARKAIYDELQRKLACEGPVVHVAYGTLFTAVADGVEGFQQMPTRSLRYLRETTLP